MTPAGWSLVAWALLALGSAGLVAGVWLCRRIRDGVGRCSLWGRPRR